MKKIYIAILLTFPLLFTSCLKSNLDDIDVYTGKDITSVRGLYYYYSESTSANGDDIFNWGNISRANVVIDADAGTVVIGTATPATEHISEFNPQKVVIYLNLSTAATIRPIDGSATPGIEADWTAGKVNRYIVTAADGSTKEWSIVVNQYI